MDRSLAGMATGSRRLTWWLAVVLPLMLGLAAIPAVVVGQEAAGTSVVSGTISTDDPLTPSSSAVAVVTILDRSARGDGQVIVGQTRVAKPGPTPISWQVAYDPTTIVAEDSYVALAAIVDGGKRWQSAEAVPVVTGGPTEQVDLRVSKVGSETPATVAGTISKNDKTALSDQAVAMAVLLDSTSGRLVAWTLRTPSGQSPIDFSIGYDPSTLAADAVLVTWASIVDGTSVWQTPTATPLADGQAGDLAVQSSVAVPAAPTPTPKPTPVIVPQVKDLPQAEAESAIVDADLALGELFEKSNEDVAKGNAIKTDPGAGTEVKPQSKVDLYISKGPSPTPTPKPTPVIVPQVKDLPQAEAESAIVDADLTLGELFEKSNEDVAKGNAIKTDPGAGTEVKPQSKVDLYISKGPSPTPTPKPTPVIVPQVKDLPQAEAESAIVDADLTLGELIKKSNEDVAKGNAIKTDPGAGTEVKPQSKVDLYISTGPSPTPTPKPTATPKPVAVPDLKGVPEADAAAELNDVGLLVGERTHKNNDSVASGAVIKSDPVAGTKVPPSSKVDLIVSKGPAPTPTPKPTPTPTPTPSPKPTASPKPVFIPDVVGLPEADAVITLTDDGLTIGQRLYEGSHSVADGLVISTEPVADSRVNPGTAVDLVVSSGPVPTPAPTPTPQPTAIPEPTPTPSYAPFPYPIVGTGFLSGTLVYRERAGDDSARQVVITLLEETGTTSRVIPTQQYLGDAPGSPLGFVLSFDWSEIHPWATYRVLAAVVSGADSWYSRGGASAITNGAGVSGLVVPLFFSEDLLEGQVLGAIIGLPADLSSTAWREVFLVRADTGAVVGHDARRSGDGPLAVFSLPFEMSDIDQSVPYVVVARVLDGPRFWTGPGVPVITLGAPFHIVVPVVEVSAHDAPLTGSSTAALPGSSASPQPSSSPASVP